MADESRLLAEQIRRMFTGEPWYGPPFRQLLESVTAETAGARPAGVSHSIWELLLHVDAWIGVALNAARGEEIPKIYGTPLDWPAPSGDWEAAVRSLFDSAERLAAAMEQFPSEQWQKTVPEREYTYYDLFQGAVQHCVYHAGQIALLKSLGRG
jgi:uncharacterized damage-inducible protein DinB